MKALSPRYSTLLEALFLAFPGSLFPGDLLYDVTRERGIHFVGVGISGGDPVTYVVPTHTSEAAAISLTNAQSVTFALRNPPPPPSSDLAVTVTASPNPVVSGQNMTFNVNVSNLGPSVAEDLVMTELTGQGANLYVNDGSGRFRDASAPSSLGALSLPYTGWGTTWFDFDNDGWLDLLIVNGTIVANERRTNQPFPYDQRKVLFRNLGNGRFENVTDRAGAAFTLSETGRGAAFGDIDNDGDVDVVVGNDAGRLRLLVNNIGNRSHWLGMRIVGKEGRDMLGARVAVIRSDGSKLWRRVRSDGSYGSANDPRVLVGLGRSAETPKVRVQWPSGHVEEWSDVAIDRWITLKEGSGR